MTRNEKLLRLAIIGVLTDLVDRYSNDENFCDSDKTSKTAGKNETKYEQLSLFGDEAKDNKPKLKRKPLFDIGGNNHE